MAVEQWNEDWASENTGKIAGLLNKIVLEKFRICSRAVLPGGLFNDIEIGVIYDVASDHMISQLHTYLTAHRADNFSYPADWWQAFKERWLPKWLLRAFPVKYRVLEIFAVYPLAIPKMQESMVLMFQTKGVHDDGSGDGNVDSDSGRGGTEGVP